MADLIFIGLMLGICIIAYLGFGWGTAYFIKEYLCNKESQSRIKLCILLSFIAWPLVWMIVPILGLVELLKK